jgi:hypothetical protein
VFPKDDDFQYHMSVTSNDIAKKSTYEFEQYYDGKGNRAVTIIRDNSKYMNEEIRIYVNGNQNERYTYVPASSYFSFAEDFSDPCTKSFFHLTTAGLCGTEVATGSTSEFINLPISEVNFNGVNHILPPFSLINYLNPSAKVNFAVSSL